MACYGGSATRHARGKWIDSRPSTRCERVRARRRQTAAWPARATAPASCRVNRARPRQQTPARSKRKSPPTLSAVLVWTTSTSRTSPRSLNTLRRHSHGGVASRRQRGLLSQSRGSTRRTSPRGPSDRRHFPDHHCALALLGKAGVRISIAPGSSLALSPIRSRSSTPPLTIAFLGATSRTARSG
jgi:hypothetical protein